MCVLCPVREDGRDVSVEGALDAEPDGDGERFNKDLKPSRMVDLEGKRRKLFFCPGMMVESKCSALNYQRSVGMVTQYTHGSLYRTAHWQYDPINKYGQY